MNLKEAFILLFTHGIPILFFTYMATDVLLRNKKKTEHILLSLISLCYLLLFAEEYIRNQVSIDYSPILSALWLSSVGIAIPGLGFHFLVKFTRLETKLPRFVYPYVFYLPLIFIFMNLVTGAKWISAQQFVQMGMWKLPVYNAGYYQAMSVSIMINFSYLIPLLIAKSKSDTLEQRTIYNHLIFGVVVSVIGHIIFGYFNFEDSLPPYPYLYSGVIWCYFLRHTMKRHDFLNLYDKRYEKLFNMNPDAILLIDRMQTVKDANPRAIQLFRSFELEFAQFFNLLDPIIKERMQAKLEIDHYETDISHNNKRLFLLVNADYVWVDNEQHVLLILRDISVQKRHQEEVKFLAYHDPLTRLPNRRYFHEKLEEALQEAERHNQTLALLLIDLDKIKLLNDTRGHLAGDETLKYAAQIIKEAVEDCGVAARMGGDEFILFIANSPSYEEVERKIEHMQEKFSKYISKYGALPVGMSIGVSRYPTDGVEGQALINIADNAMYEMKRSRA
ncbi:GGDEF domain-containing protein [Paenibacillus contaminans]|uniref:GGDEF domain-containing protein n=1 Tax=Paenibacillus contaminans TaxID=450362 RepID=A0A329MN82_9BACL|nr:sensor domain-containing diguanylate cyclase [Paenibacillus contaminans]RAV19367.1 hypothetical protein DQG23_20430 [Paenibacillus contaminans]